MIYARPLTIPPWLAAPFRDHLDARRRVQLERELADLIAVVDRPIATTTQAPYRRLQRERQKARIAEIRRLLNGEG